MEIIEITDRDSLLIEQLLNIWESSVRATHLFLSAKEIDVSPVPNTSFSVSERNRQYQTVCPPGIEGSTAFSVSVQGATRSKPRDFSDFQRYPQSAYVLYASIVCLVNR